MELDTLRLLCTEPDDAAAELARLDGPAATDAFVRLCRAAHEQPDTHRRVAAVVSAYRTQAGAGTADRCHAARAALAMRCTLRGGYDHLGGEFRPEDHLQDLTGAFDALDDPLCAELACHDMTCGLTATANAAVTCRELTRLAARAATLDRPARQIARQLAADRAPLHAAQMLDAAQQLATTP